MSTGPSRAVGESETSEVGAGKATEVAMKIFKLYDHVLETSTRIDSGFNLVVRVYYGSTQDLHSLIDALKGMLHVTKVRFSEISAIIDRRAFTE